MRHCWRDRCIERRSGGHPARVARSQRANSYFRTMSPKDTIRMSKFLSLILRHEPERVGLNLDSAGWVGVTELVEAVNRHGVSLTLSQLKQVVERNDKKRFAFNEDGQRIRASQGHSVEVDLQY